MVTVEHKKDERKIKTTKEIKEKEKIDIILWIYLIE